MVARAFADHDADHNGVLDFEEFKGFYNAAILEAGSGASFSTSKPSAAPANSEKARSKAKVAEERLSQVHKQTLGDARVAALDKMFGMLQLVDGKADLHECQERFGADFAEVIATHGGGEVNFASQLDRDGDKKVTHAEWLHYFVQLSMTKGPATVDEIAGTCTRARSWTRA